MGERFSKITGIGVYLPNTVTNDELARFGVGTSGEWIKQRTGIERRCVASREEGLDFMAISAARQALEMANAHNERRAQMIIVPTNTAATLPQSCSGFPPTAAYVQEGLKDLVVPNCGFFDLISGCSGINYGQAIGDSMIKSGLYDRVVVIGADRLWGITDLNERGTASVLGDGASAYVLDVSHTPGFVAHRLHGDGSKRNLIVSPCMDRRSIHDPDGPKVYSPTIQMDGKEVYRFVVSLLVDTFTEFGEDEVLNPVSYRIPVRDLVRVGAHQANMRIFEGAAERIARISSLGLTSERIMEMFVTTIQTTGNNSVASQGPVTREILFGERRVEPGSHVLFMGYGAGLSWAKNHYIA